MTDLRKAAEMALECLNYHWDYFEDESGDGLYVLEAKKALRQALAQPEQKPVRWINFNAATGQESIDDYCDSELASIPLYTAPPKREWVGLTDEEINDWFFQRLKQAGSGWALDDVVRAVEAKLKEKNT